MLVQTQQNFVQRVIQITDGGLKLKRSENKNGFLNLKKVREWEGHTSVTVQRILKALILG